MCCFFSDAPKWKLDDPSNIQSNPKFAMALSMPLSLSFLVLLPHWWLTEKTACRRLMTLPLLLLHIWPQYRVLILLITLWNDQEDFHTKLEKYNRDVTCLGKRASKFWNTLFPKIWTSEIGLNQSYKDKYSRMDWRCAPPNAWNLVA